MVVTVPAWLANFISSIKAPLILSLVPQLPATGNHASTTPVGIIFPLSLGRLITLIQYNVLRACIANLQFLFLFETILVREFSSVFRINPVAKFSDDSQAIITPLLQQTPSKAQSNSHH